MWSSLRHSERGSAMVEYLLVTPVVVALLGALLIQGAMAAVGLIACESAARDAAVAAARGNDPLLAARQAAPDWSVTVTGPEAVEYGDYRGVRVTVALNLPVLPIRWLAGQHFTIARTVTMPLERG